MQTIFGRGIWLGKYYEAEQINKCKVKLLISLILLKSESFKPFFRTILIEVERKSKTV